MWWVTFVTTIARPVMKIKFSNLKSKTLPDLLINAEEFISIKGYKAIGNQLCLHKIKKVIIAEELLYEEEKKKKLEELEVDSVEQIDSDESQIKIEF